MSKFSQNSPFKSRGNPGANSPPLSERLCVKAFVAAYLGKPWERYITFARVAARREEAEAAERERRERAIRRAKFDRAFEQAQDQLRRSARV